MHPSTSTKGAPLSRPRSLALLCSLLLAGTAAAQEAGSPWYLGAALNRTHDSNVQRLPDARSDSFTTASLLAGIDRPIGRHRLYASLRANRQTFDDLAQYDNTGHDSALGFDWSTVNRLSGSLKFDASRALSSFADTRTIDPTAPLASTLQRNILERRRFNAAIQKGAADSDLELFADFDTRRVEHSAAVFQDRNNERHALRGGLRWHRSDLLTLGAAVVGARGEHPDGSTPDEYDSRALELAARWKATGASTFDARMQFENRDYDVQTQRDFSGLNGLLSWIWTPTGKLRFTTTLKREGEDSERFDTPLPGQTFGGVRTSNSIELRGDWAATAKIAVNANLRHTRRDLVAATAASGEDRTRFAGLGATWAPTRALTLGCNLGHESRSSDFANQDFSARTAGCYVQALLQ